MSFRWVVIHKRGFCFSGARVGVLCVWWCNFMGGGELVLAEGSRRGHARAGPHRPAIQMHVSKRQLVCQRLPLARAQPAVDRVKPAQAGQRAQHAGNGRKVGLQQGQGRRPGTEHELSKARMDT